MKLNDIPLVLTDEIPFVVTPAPRPGPFLEHGGSRLRRGPDRVTFEWPSAPVWVHGVALESDEGCFAMASLGSLMDGLWRAQADTGRLPAGLDTKTTSALVQALTGRGVEVAVGDASVKVAFAPPNPPEIPLSLALLGMEGSLAADLGFLSLMATAAARAAIDVLADIFKAYPATPTILFPEGWSPRMETHDWLALISQGISVIDTAGDYAEMLGILDR